MLLLAIIVSATVSWLLARAITRPVTQLRHATVSLADGKLDSRAPRSLGSRRDEFGLLARDFDAMADKLQRSARQQTELSRNISHELRSPLARMKVALEMLPEGDKRDQIAADIREMEALTSALLERERIKNRASNPNHEAFDLVALVRELIAAFDDSGPGVIVSAAPDSLPIRADQALIKVLLQNLVDNAVKFSLDDSAAVEVSVESDGELVTVSIEDDGPGIPEDQADKVLEPFVKLDPSRGHRNGYGLGLNLCQRIVQAHAGKLNIEQRQPRGTRIFVNLPVGSKI
jgi:two-component system sensor histidine kinase CpxA